LAVQLIRGVFLLDISFICRFRVIRFLLFSGVFIAKEVDGVQAKGSGNITTVFIHTLRP
jgi:hypothetical protein